MDSCEEEDTERERERGEGEQHVAAYTRNRRTKIASKRSDLNDHKH